MTTAIETAFSYLDISHPTVREALAEIEGLRRDAQRYRMARSGKALNVRVPVKDKFVTYCLTDKPEEGFPAAYDQAIDAAIASQSAKEPR